MSAKLPALPIDPLLLENRISEIPFEFDSYEDELEFKNILAEWSKEYGSIFTTEVNETVFFFRALTHKEMNFAKKAYSDNYDRTEYICKICVLDPAIEDYSLDIFAGVPETLCHNILEESGFTDVKQTTDMMAIWEHNMQDIDNQIPLVIKEAFQDIPLAEIESWTMEKTIEYYIKAKWLLENLRGLELVTSEE